MTDARLRRFAYLHNATVGRLTVGNFSCWTVERPWLDNRTFVSCIPDGVYECRPFNGKKHKSVIEITAVPGRTYILFHAANHPEELEGCIAPGLHHAISEDDARVWESYNAMEKLKSLTGSSFTLSIYSADALLPSPNPAASLT